MQEYLTLVPGYSTGIRASKYWVLNKGRGSNFREGCRVWQETPEEGQITYQPNRCEYNNKDEDDIPKNVNDKKYMSAIFY